MKFSTAFWTTPTGHLALAGVMLIGGALLVVWQRKRPAPLPPPAMVRTAAALPQTHIREGRRLAMPAPLPESLPTSGDGDPKAAPADTGRRPRESKPPMLPLSLISGGRADAHELAPVFAPFGRLIPCETVIAIESSRLDTPVIGLTTEDVWHDGKLVIPAGAEVHGRASLDRSRERIAAQGAWVVVWRTPDAANGTELVVQGLALDRERDRSGEALGQTDGSAGLRGQLLRSDSMEEIKLFAAAFLNTATAALQDTKSSLSPFGESSLPTATARNAALAGSGAILREYAQQIRETIARDGFYVRVPAGKPFYLYVTQTLDRGQGRRGSPKPSNEK